MAHLKPRGDDRAQLVLVTGLVIAVAMVAMVLLLNATIYTQNLSARDAGPGGEDALAYQHSVVEGVGGVVDRENEQDYGTWAAVETNVSAGVARHDELVTRQYLQFGTLATVNRSDAVYHRGELIRQPTDRNFTDQTGLLTTWDLAWNVPNTRRFSMTVERSSLEPATTSDLSSTFRVVVSENATSTAWRAYVYNNSTTGDVAVAVDPGGAATVTEVCSVDAAETTVDFTSGTLGGESCPGLQWAKGLDQVYDIRYENGNNARGTYNLTVNTTPTLATVHPTNFAAGGQPYHVPAVYDVSLPLQFQTGELTYRIRLRIAPGEPDA